MDPRADRIVTDVTSLDADLTARTQELADADEALAMCQANLATRTQERDAAQAANATCQTTVATRTQERDQARADLAACEARPPTGTVVRRFAGDPGPGMAYIGLGGGNSDPSALESNAGRPYGIRRTYWRGDQVAAAVTAAQADHTAGRVPWLSFKLTGGQTWATAKTGGADAWFADICSRLNALGKPVWFTVHHEPEGDALETDWTAMQARFGPVVAANYPNLTYSVILMGYQQFYGPPNHTLDALWPGDAAKIKLIGFDPYNWHGTNKNGAQEDMDAKYWSKIEAWVKLHPGVAWAVSETALSNTAFAAAQTATAMGGKDWMTRSVDRAIARGAVAWMYFDYQLTTEDPSWTWPLGAAGTPKREAFHNLVRQVNSARLS